MTTVNRRRRKKGEYLVELIKDDNLRNVDFLPPWIRVGVLQKHKWENAMTIDKTSWGYRRDTKYSDFLTMDEITQTLAETIRSVCSDFVFCFCCCYFYVPPFPGRLVVIVC